MDKRIPNQVDNRESAEMVGEASSSRADAPETRFIASRPLPRPVFSRATAKWCWSQIAVTSYLFIHTLRPYERRPNHPHEITLEDPAGEINQDQLAVVQYIAERADKRQERLEQKATASLAVIALFTPLLVSTGIYILRTRSGGSAFPLIMILASLGLILLSLIASVRALSVREHDDLSITAVIDPAGREIKEHRPDHFGRGLLWVATRREALNDHLCDFVRASQAFLALAVLGVLLGAFPLITTAGRKQPVNVTGIVGLDSATTSLIEVTRDSLAASFDRELSALRIDLDSVSARPDSLR